ncbi:MAG: hypothetical protein LBC59_00590 [Chitinispirillales bacterium]|jgi:hypothetical protein|nr:hypothetical protein [Chitinispirillales bacterium]
MQVKKKAAKKTYNSAAKKKTVPSLNKVTLDDVLALQAKTEASIQELSAENRLLAAEVRKTSVAVRELTQNMGGINNSFGTLVEIVVIPKVRHDINAMGKHTFNRVLVNKKVSALVAGEKNIIGEIDLFLFSDADKEAMIVEIKAQISKKQVEERLERLKKYRKYEEEAEIKGKKLYGAVAAIYIDPRVKAFALENGLYVIEIHEEEDKLEITKPETAKSF